MQMFFSLFKPLCIEMAKANFYTNIRKFIVKLLGQVQTWSWICFPPVTRTTINTNKNKNNPHQKLPEQSKLQVWKMTFDGR